MSMFRKTCKMLQKILHKKPSRLSLEAYQQKLLNSSGIIKMSICEHLLPIKPYLWNFKFKLTRHDLGHDLFFRKFNENETKLTIFFFFENCHVIFLLRRNVFWSFRDDLMLERKSMIYVACVIYVTKIYCLK
jgi:hypothetical protein